jgi:mannose-1-phosphate guanylyltransferase
MVQSKVVGLVLAGGEGRRLRPLTYYFQKCMIPIGSKQKPLLEYILLLMKLHKISDVKLLVGYKSEQIKNYFDDGSRFELKIDYLTDDPTLSGSGGAILNAARKGTLEDAEDLLIYYGDIISNLNLTEMIHQHLDEKNAATLAVTRGFKVPVGVAELEGKRITGWVEKPEIDIYAGIGIILLRKKALEALGMLAEGREKMDLMGDIIPSLIGMEERVGAYVTDAFWYDVGSTEKYEKLDNHIVDTLFKTPDQDKSKN